MPPANFSWVWSQEVCCMESSNGRSWEHQSRSSCKRGGSNSRDIRKCSSPRESLDEKNCLAIIVARRNTWWKIVGYEKNEENMKNEGKFEFNEYTTTTTRWFNYIWIQSSILVLHVRDTDWVIDMGASYHVSTHRVLHNLSKWWYCYWQDGKQRRILG